MPHCILASLRQLLEYVFVQDVCQDVDDSNLEWLDRHGRNVGYFSHGPARIIAHK